MNVTISYPVTTTGSSMTTPEYDSYMYLEPYLFEYEDDSCYEASGLDLPDRLLVFLSCLGLSGNCTVLWVLLRYVKLRTMIDVCLFNLALSDLILAASLLLRVYHSHLALCKLMTLVFQLGFYSGTFFVTLMSVALYLTIVHAVAAMWARTLHYGVIASITIWVISIIAGIPQVIFASLEIDPDGNSSQCQPLYPEDMHRFWKMMRNFSENTVGLFVCLPIMIFCYVHILVVLSKCRNTKRNRAVKLIFTIVCVFVVCWVPYNVTVFLQTLQLFDILITCEAVNNINSAMYYAEIIALCHCCVNPLIYAFVNKKFKKSMDIVRRISTDNPAGENDISADGLLAAETPETERHSTHL